MFCHVSLLAVPELPAVMVMVIVEEVTVAAIVPLFGVPLMLFAAVPLPVTLTFTGTPGLNAKPRGTVRTIVPVPILPALFSARPGPVKVSQAPLV
jgi:hypothetical protein